MTMPLSALVERNSIVNPEASAALGAPVTLILDREGTRHPLGVVVDVSENRRSVWVRRFDEPADTSVLYAVDELERATTEDLASIARLILGRQYRETRELRARIEKETR